MHPRWENTLIRAQEFINQGNKPTFTLFNLRGKEGSCAVKQLKTNITMAIEDKKKRVVQIEIDDEVKKLTVEGVDKDAQVVMRQELSDDELDNVAGGGGFSNRETCYPDLSSYCKKLGCILDGKIP